MNIKLNKKAIILLIIGLILIVILSIIEGIIKDSIDKKVVNENRETLKTKQQAFGNNLYNISNFKDIFVYYSDSEMSIAYKLKDEITEVIEANFGERKWSIEDVTINKNGEIIFKIISSYNKKIINGVIKYDKVISMKCNDEELIESARENNQGDVLNSDIDTNIIEENVVY